MVATHWQIPYVRHRLIRAAETAAAEAPRRAALVAFAAAVVAAVIGATFLALPSPSGASAEPETVIDTSDWLTRELPREWRGARKAVAFEHIYRPGASFPSYDHMYRKAR